VANASLETKKYVSYVSENVMLYDNFTAYQNLDFFAKLGGKRNISKAEYFNLFRSIGLQEDAIEQKLKKFSKGMRQKVGLAIAMVKDTDNILLDEPTSGLDPKAANEFMGILKALRDNGKSILMCTHDIFRAKEIADRVGIMKNGRMVMQRTNKQLENDDLEKIYLDYMQQVPMI
jgi:ABC-2 type transport system ATP-binding protein